MSEQIDPIHRADILLAALAVGRQLIDELQAKINDTPRLLNDGGDDTHRYC